MGEAAHHAEAYGPQTPSEGRWPVWAWALLVVLALLGAAVSLVAAGLAVFGNSTTCDGDPSPLQVARGQHDLLFIAFFAVLPACLAAIFVRPRIRVLVAGAVCAAPPLAIWASNLADPNAYRGSFCF